MSQRGKRQPNRTDDGPVPAKRRKCRPTPTPTPTPTEEEEALAAAAAAAAAAQAGAGWTPRPLNDLKISSIYNRSATEAPAELFRKDLISAMKLPDSEPLSPDEYWIITDQWKQEWERGVQVPVNPDSLPEATVTVNHCGPTNKLSQDFKLPKSKYIRITKDEFFTNEDHFLSNAPAKAEKACSYDLDDCDVTWLQIVNGERALMGLQPITEDQLEQVIEELETRCWEKVQTIVKTEEGLGIEYDENVICDVCRSPDSEEGNEMVFCDMCNICVHQACYGITTIPSGSWLCRTCALSLRPECVLCPNKGGAMKCTRSGQKWAHVSCALWIPEVSIGCVEKMEPITKISSIPQSRWALICVLCRERVGACIQCSVKTCKTAYHVTCAFKHGLEMRAIIEDENADDGVKLRSYCQKHSVTSKKEKSGSASDDDESKRKKRKDMTSEEKNQARAAKLQEIEAEFDKHVSIKDVTLLMDVDAEGIQYIYNYWKLKRKAGFNKPLLPPKHEDVDILSRQQEQADIEKMKMFVQLRQDLERVRNLCYMVSRREKLSRSFFRMREQTFHKQVAVLSDTSYNLKTKEIAAVIEANHGPSIYDKLYSQPSAEDETEDFEVVLARIAGISSPIHPTSEEKSKMDLNGLVKCSSDKKSIENPYKRLYFNGATRHRSSLYSMSSGSETDTGMCSSRRIKVDVSSNKNLNNCAPLRSSIQDSAASTTDDDDDKIVNAVHRRLTSRRGIITDVAKLSEKSRNNKRNILSRIKIETSSEEESKQNKNVWQTPCSRTLRQMERELGDKVSASDDSEELLPITGPKTRQHSISAIYSDSESDISLKGDGFKDEDKSSSNTPSDSQQHVLRTKAAVKEFSVAIESVDKSVPKSIKNTRVSKKSRDRPVDLVDEDSTKDKENLKSSVKKELDTTELIVPQRQAAKKATESMRYSQSKPKDQSGVEQEVLKTSPLNEDTKFKPKSKFKIKEGKDSKASKEGKLGDVYDFEKDSEAQEILAYVPQRQAAKKAAAHIKSGGTVKAVPGESDQEGSKIKKDEGDFQTKSKKEIDHIKVKKESDNEKKSVPRNSDSHSKGKSTLATSSSSSSSCSTSDSSSSSDSDDINEDEPKDLKSLKKDAKRTNVDKRNSVESPSKDNSNVKEKKNHQERKSKTASDWPFLDKEHQSVSSLSCSDSESDENIKSRKKRTVVSHVLKNESFGKSRDSKCPESIGSEVSDDNERKSSNSKLAGKKFKKAPDKKLKTSDGRPESEFQPPVSEREKFSKVKNKLFRRRKFGSQKISAPIDCNRVRDSEARSGDIHGSKTQSTSSRETYQKESESRENSSIKSSSPRTQKLSKWAGNRESDSERVKKVETGEETNIEGRKRKSSEKFSSQSTSTSGQCEERDDKKTKSKSRPSNVISAAIKKSDKKVTETESIIKEEKGVGEESQGLTSDSKMSEATPTQESTGGSKCSPTSILEKEITQRKAEREMSKKINNKGGLDRLFERRDKTIEKILSCKAGNKDAIQRNEKSGFHKDNHEKNATLENVEVLSPKDDGKCAIDVKDHRKLTVNESLCHKNKDSSISSKDSIKATQEDSSKIKDTVDEEIHNDSQDAENYQGKKKEKMAGSCKSNIVSPCSARELASKGQKCNSVIMNLEKNLKKNEKHSVIQNTSEQIRNMKSGKESPKKNPIPATNADVIENHAPHSNVSSEKIPRKEPKDPSEQEDKNKRKWKNLSRTKKFHSQHHEPHDSTMKDKLNNDLTVNATKAIDKIETSVKQSNKKSSAGILEKQVSREIPQRFAKETHSSKSATNSKSSVEISSPDDGNRCTQPNKSSLHVQEKSIAKVGSDSTKHEVEAGSRKIASRSSSVISAHPQRSLFSPQQQSKESGVSELFDFEGDILAVDDDGFSIPRDSDEMMRAPLSFSFSSEFLFKEDTKEDSARETLNLVEKLRLEYAKKSSTSTSKSDVSDRNKSSKSPLSTADSKDTSGAPPPPPPPPARAPHPPPPLSPNTAAAALINKSTTATPIIATPTIITATRTLNTSPSPKTTTSTIVTTTCATLNSSVDAVSTHSNKNDTVSATATTTTTITTGKTKGFVNTLCKVSTSSGNKMTTVTSLLPPSYPPTVASVSSCSSIHSPTLFLSSTSNSFTDVTPGAISYSSSGVIATTVSTVITNPSAAITATTSACATPVSTVSIATPAIVSTITTSHSISVPSNATPLGIAASTITAVGAATMNIVVSTPFTTISTNMNSTISATSSNTSTSTITSTINAATNTSISSDTPTTITTTTITTTSTATAVSTSSIIISAPASVNTMPSVSAISSTNKSCNKTPTIPGVVHASPPLSSVIASNSGGSRRGKDGHDLSVATSNNSGGLTHISSSKISISSATCTVADIGVINRNEGRSCKSNSNMSSSGVAITAGTVAPCVAIPTCRNSCSGDGVGNSSTNICNKGGNRSVYSDNVSLGSGDIASNPDSCTGDSVSSSNGSRRRRGRTSNSRTNSSSSKSSCSRRSRSSSRGSNSLSINTSITNDAAYSEQTDTSSVASAATIDDVNVATTIANTSTTSTSTAAASVPVEATFTNTTASFGVADCKTPSGPILNRTCAPLSAAAAAVSSVFGPATGATLAPVTTATYAPFTICSASHPVGSSGVPSHKLCSVPERDLPDNTNVSGDSDIEIKDNPRATLRETKIKKIIHSSQGKHPCYSESVDEYDSSEMPAKGEPRRKHDVPYISDNIGPYEYPRCEVPLDVPKVSIPGREKLDRCNSAQADERWVPPSLDFMTPHSSILPLPYESIPPPPVDCQSSPSPYTDHRNRGKWADCEVLPIRRSSSSSAASTSSTSSHRDDVESQKHDELVLQSHTPGVDGTYPSLHPGIASYSSCSLSEAPPYHPYSEATPFVGPVNVFPPSACPPIPFASSGAPIFPPPFGASFSGPHPILSPVPKPSEDQTRRPPPCVATFTSSSHNMALTAAMVSPSGPPSNVVVSAPSPVLCVNSPFTPQETEHLQMPMSPNTIYEKKSEHQKQQNQLKHQQENHLQDREIHCMRRQDQSLEQSQLHAPQLQYTTQLQSTVTLPSPPSHPSSPVALPFSRQPSLPSPPHPSSPGASPPSSPPLPPPPPRPLSTSSLQSSDSMQSTIPQDSPSSKPSINCNVIGKKSPVKPTRTSARFTSQLGKSPGKSPKQDNSTTKSAQTRVRENNGKRPSGGKISVNRTAYHQSRGAARRCRGRGRHQNAQVHLDSEYHGNNTIHSKLVGTVYDLEFDDDSPSESVENLRAMRERRRSTDIHERKSDVTFMPKNSPSPKLTSSPLHVQNSKMRAYTGSGVRELRPPSPLGPSLAASDKVAPSLSPIPNASSEPFPDVVQPVLPGPVDMRTYSSSYEPNANNNSTSYSNTVLGTFPSESAEPHVADFDEDMESELQSALAASKNTDVNQTPNKPGNLLDVKRVPEIPSETSTSTSNKVSLSDSRNQLKVKIKGPFLDANYAATTSTVPSLSQQQPTLPTLNPLDVSSSNISTATTVVSSTSASSGTSNLRRMRKKELLRQYWTQDMNMDDPASVPTGQVMVPTTTPPVNRTVITIPKAVASMTSIPTRDDYKAVVDANMEKKRRKEKLSLTSSVSRELRHLDLPPSLEDTLERRSGIGGGISLLAHTPDGTTPPIKRRGRPPKTTASLNEPLAPKLKIKIGNSVVAPSDTDSNVEEKKLRVRPPKKRLMNVQMPSVDELKRESMKFRRRIMADFEEEEKKESKVVSGKRRKHRQSDSQREVELIDRTHTENVSTPKIVIRINKRVSGSASSDSVKSVAGENVSALPPKEEHSECQSVSTPPLENEKEPPSLSGDDKSNDVKRVPADSNKNSENGTVPKNIRTSKMSPIRLKLARCQEGYVMKTQSYQEVSTSVAPTSMAPNVTEDVNSDASVSDLQNTLIVSKGCEVR